MKAERAVGSPLVVDYFFSVLSDWAYMGGERFESLMRRYGAQVNYKPMKLAELYAATGGIVLQKRSSQRQDYRVVELERWRDKLGMPITLHPRYYPADDTLAACVIVAATKTDADVGRLINLIHRAIWAEEQDVSDPGTLERIISACHIDAGRLLKAARAADVSETLDQNTREAAERGAFGSPFYFLGDGHGYWGQDRLDFLEEEMARAQWEARLDAK